MSKSTVVERGGPWYVVWSNQRGMWWRQNWSGYTQFLHEAGRYNRTEADLIVSRATAEGQLVRTRVDPVTGREHTYFDEVALLAPEATQ